MAAGGSGQGEPSEVAEASSMSDTKLADLEKECQRLEHQVDAQAQELSLLRARFERYEATLRGSQVTVYTQDRNLRYTSISHGMLGRSAEEILGRTDEELLPADCGASIIALKREAMASGDPKRGEFAFGEGPGARWHDVHIEPLRDEAGRIVGLTCASVDVTKRKEDEAHLRLLLRELTHRSKNLLAVIQAMARQTARHAGSIDGFLAQFAARLQGMASSHDLLVRESWHGASLGELVRSQLAAYVDRGQGQIAFEGPDVAIKPEAAQNLGLALHELAINAKKFGALSVPDGRVLVRWGRHDGGEDDPIELSWVEQFGPKVKARRKRGFGSLVIERNLARSLDAEVNLEFEPDGVRCRIVIPASQVVAAR
jgi:PAS domain S-box-containing protein